MWHYNQDNCRVLRIIHVLLFWSSEFVQYLSSSFSVYSNRKITHLLLEYLMSTQGHLQASVY